jgi:hypothetical protein
MDNLQYLKPSLQRPQKRRDKRLDEELIECYRHGTRSKAKKGYKNKLKRNLYEHAPMHESIKYMHGGGTKYFNDNLEPMIRFLNSMVGKNWNKVHATLCSRLSKKTVPGLHVFNHLYDFVHENTFIEGNKIFYSWFGRYHELISSEKRPQFYINHKTGQLMKAKIGSGKIKKL